MCHCRLYVKLTEKTFSERKIIFQKILHDFLVKGDWSGFYKKNNVVSSYKNQEFLCKNSLKRIHIFSDLIDLSFPKKMTVTVLNTNEMMRFWFDSCCLLQSTRFEAFLWKNDESLWFIIVFSVFLSAGCAMRKCSFFVEERKS